MKRSCRLTPRPRARAPWLRLTRSWWTWAPPPRTHLHPGHCGDGGGGGGGDDDGRHPGPPRHPAAPFLPVAIVASCWPRPHLKREERDFSKDDFTAQSWLNQLHFTGRLNLLLPPVWIVLPVLLCFSKIYFSINLNGAA